MLRAVSESLRHLGYNVLEAPHGAAAIEIWKAESAAVDLLFTDMIMPGGISGLDLARRFQQEKPGLKVVISTGYGTEIGEGKAAFPGSMASLRKPYQAGALARTVRACLDGQTI